MRTSTVTGVLVAEFPAASVISKITSCPGVICTYLKIVRRQWALRSPHLREEQGNAPPDDISGSGVRKYCVCGVEVIDVQMIRCLHMVICVRNATDDTTGIIVYEQCHQTIAQRSCHRHEEPLATLSIVLTLIPEGSILGRARGEQVQAWKMLEADG